MATFRRPDLPVPVETRGSRSGYVYVAQSPEREDACKVGYTMRPPHVRMKELGRTTWLLPVRVQSARFFWDAITIERQMHRALAPFAMEGVEEWFAIPAWQVAGLLREMPQLAPASHAQDWEDGLSFSEQMDWAMDLLRSPLKKGQKAGWRDIERLSSMGHGPASWMLAEKLLATNPDEPDRALWVLDAAVVQGHLPASLRKDWVASLSSSDPSRRVWRACAQKFTEKYPDPESWSEEDHATMLHEARLWKRNPRMAWDNAVIAALPA